MDEELQKPSTDCVYFLASPLTCKKGIECEYRHSEVARLNPRDCWYWLAGSCLNPSCAFRHPPLDVHAKVSSKSAPLQYQFSVPPANKLNTSCYFYFNGFCNKGDRCPFLHGPYDGGKPALKPSKTVSAVTGALPLKNKTPAASDAGSTPIKALPNPSEAASKRVTEILIMPKPDVQLSAPTNVKDESVSPHMLASEAASVRSEMLFPRTNLIQTRSLVCTDPCSEADAVDSHLDREICQESSSGFDVLVDDDRLQNLGFEQEPEYMRSMDSDGEELHGRFSGYDYEDPVKDDSTYHDTHLFYEQDRYDSFDKFHHRERFDSTSEFHGHSRERMLEKILSRERKSFSVKLGTDDQRGADLRNDFKKHRRVIDSRRVTRFSKRNNASFLVDGILKRPQKLVAPWLYGRLNSQVHSDRVGSFSKDGNLLCPNRLRHQYIEKRQRRERFDPSEISWKPVSRKGRSTEENSTVFTGPKSLAQIRYEKAKAKENGDSSCRSTSEEFQGPKPLSQILKERKKLLSVIEAENYSC